MIDTHFGVVDKRFLAQSIGLLSPKDPILMSDERPLREALMLLKKNRIGSLVATDHQGKISGLLSERDIILKVDLDASNLDTIRVSQIMTPKPKTIDMGTSIAFALHLMSQGGFRHLPIVDDEDFPVGIISVKDIVDHIVRSFVSAIDAI